MKQGKQKYRATALTALHDGFVRGSVSTGLIALMAGERDRQRLLRLSLQGGLAMAAGGLAAHATIEGSAAGALGAVAVGALGLGLFARAGQPGAVARIGRQS